MSVVLLIELSLFIGINKYIPHPNYTLFEWGVSYFPSISDSPLAYSTVSYT